MPIYTYECKEHAATDVLVHGFDPHAETYWCPECGQEMDLVVTAPSRVFIERDWNDKANDYQGHGPYHQSKSQLQNYRRGSLEHLERDCDRSPDPVTEEAIQIGAKAIHEGEVNPRPDPQQRQIQRIRREQKERRAKLNT